MKNFKGYSLVTVLIASAIASVLVTAVLLLVDNVTTTIARTRAADNIENAIKTVQTIVTNKDLCDNALRLDSATQKIPFAPTGSGYTSPINRIYLQNSDGEPGATIVLRRGGSVGTGYTVNNIFLRERVSEQGRGQYTLGGNTFDSFSTEIVIEIFGGQGIHQRVIPYNAVVGSGGTVDRCVQDSSIQYMCEQFGGTYNVGTGECDGIMSSMTLPNCQTRLSGTPDDCAPTDPANTICDSVYYLAGFEYVANVGASPVCKCQKVCYAENGGIPPTGSSSPPGPGGGGARGGVPGGGVGNGGGSTDSNSGN